MVLGPQVPVGSLDFSLSSSLLSLPPSLCLSPGEGGGEETVRGFSSLGGVVPFKFFHVGLGVGFEKPEGGGLGC